ncbi:hypothetical protein Rhopal_006108-T1 [Rhodotorula paludigena]|uniref:Large ribosomal subunit protein mL54 n=1 Tax=Rhodotorula paludigena TaxID=86838 RepID=A0AAV5GS55_9BASI|nr:hypothetical protein Rhopal_006108-T1 [Rhodotorula paludigena]
MSCTCHALVSAARQPSRRIARPVHALFARSFSSSVATQSAPTLNTKLKSGSTAPIPPTSSCPPGTVLKNLNYLKDGADPVALPEADYPPWLWTLLEPATKEHGQNDEAANLRKQKKALKREAKTGIKAANALKG